MGTYSITKILRDYELGSMPVEMAVGHSLQHIKLLYEAQTASQMAQNKNGTELKSLAAKLDKLQADVDRLTALVKKP